MSNVYQQVEKDGKRLTVYYEEDAESPRDWDNLGIMYCKWNGYNLGDVQVNSMEDIYEDLAERLNIEVKYKRNGDIAKETINEIDSKCFIFPLYCLEHSGISISMSSFGDPWDSGCCGRIVVLKDTLNNECGTTDKLEAIRHLKSEVDTYNKYLNGEVYWYECDTVKTCECCGQEVTELVDSCCGFYDMDGIVDSVPDDFRDLAKEL